MCLYVCECVLETEGNLGEGRMFLLSLMYSCLRPEIQCKDKRGDNATCTNVLVELFPL